MRGLAAGILAGLLGLGAPASAELRRVETVGSAALLNAAEGPSAREAALREGLAEAVRSVARDLLRATSIPDADALDRALGPLPGSYVLRKRVVEDRGEREALLAANPATTREYVVVVEAEVDVDRVRGRLAEAGLAPSPAPQAPAPVPAQAPAGVGSASGAPAPAPRVALSAPPGQVLLILEAPTGPVYTALRDGLRADAEVQSVLPLEFAASEAALAVTTTLGPGDLIARLRGALPELRIEEVRPPEGRVAVVRAELAPPPEPPPTGSEPGASPAPPGAVPPGLPATGPAEPE